MELKITKIPNHKKYYQAVAYLEKLATEPLAIDYMKRNATDPNIYLERTRYLLKLLGDPHRGFKYIHVTGTAGKGSTVARLHEILYRAGYRVGSFMSPFATTSIEKIKVNDKLIDPFVFAKLTEKIKPAITKMKANSPYGRPSYFECFFALALLYFKKMRCQWAVLEVGLGGKFDATNVIDHSEVSAITNIGLDHTELLGKTLSSIAGDKAGIIKPNSHFFTSETRPSLLKLFKAVCKKQRTKIHIVIPHLMRDPGFKAQFLDSRFRGNDNLATAIARHLNINDNIITRALARVTLPCRFEIMQTSPLVILDGAHNPLKIKNVMHNLKSLTYKKLYIIFASSANKDAQSMVRLLSSAATEIVFTQFKSPRRAAFNPKTLARFAPGNLLKRIELNPEKALKQTLKKLKPEDALLITGSFYLAGELRKRWVSEETILRNRTYVQ